MKIKAVIEKTMRKLDRLSPWPLLYPFVMSDNEKVVFDNAIKNSRHYLEFGLGGSTIRALQQSKATIHTVESSTDWINYMRQYFVIRHQEGKRLHIFPVDIGPTREWGYPVSDNFKDSFESYSSGVFQSVQCELIDLVLVDGRFRVACILKAILACCKNEKIQIIVHDFWNRPHYHVVLDYLDCMDRADTIGLFSIKKNIDFKSLGEEYEKYKHIAE